MYQGLLMMAFYLISESSPVSEVFGERTQPATARNESVSRIRHFVHGADESRRLCRSQRPGSPSHLEATNRPTAGGGFDERDASFV